MDALLFYTFTPNVIWSSKSLLILKLAKSTTICNIEVANSKKIILTFHPSYLYFDK